MNTNQEEITYRTFYLLQNNWKRIYPYDKIFKNELKRLEISKFSEIDFNIPFWIKQTKEKDWEYYQQSLLVDNFGISQLYRNSIFFSLNDAFDFEMELNK